MQPFRTCPWPLSASRHAPRILRRTLATSTQQAHVVILGGGITGLSAAYHLSRGSKDTLITLLESSTRLGGWLDSDRVDVHSAESSASLVLEAGPRTLRPNSKAMMELIHLLQLEDELITVPKTSPAARNRFLYLAGSRNGLTKLPSPASLASLWTSSVGSTLVSALMNEFWIGANRPDVTDESVDAFLSRRFGSEVARQFASAMTHGIYAADSRRLSVRASFPSLWNAEARGDGSVVWGLMKPSFAPQMKEDYDTGDELQAFMAQASVYSFKRGLSTLTDAMLQNFQANNKVEVRLGDGATFINLGDKFEVRTTSGSVLEPTHIISALPLKRLSDVITDSPLKAALSTGMPPSSSVYVTNLIFAPTKKPIHPAGYGYLIPRSKEGYPSKENKQGMLGVVFDSVSLGEQDSDQRYTKMTVISGGPYALPSPNVDALLDAIRVHLGSEYEVPTPVYTKVTECRDCIPLYEVGHLDWVKELKGSLISYGERMHVIGAGIGGVSVPNCVEQGREAARDIVRSL